MTGTVHLVSNDGATTLTPWPLSDLTEIATVIDRTFNDRQDGWPMYGCADAHALVALLASAHRAGVAALWQVRHHEVLAGYTGVMKAPGERTTLATSTYLDPAVRGGDLNSRLKTLLAHAARTADTPLIATVQVTNARANAAMRRLLVPQQPTSRASHQRDTGTNDDTCIYRISDVLGGAEAEWPPESLAECASAMRQITAPYGLAA